MKPRRAEKLNSLLRETIAHVIRHKVAHPGLSLHLSITSVSISKDMHYARVYVSILEKEKRKECLAALESASGFIAVQASKKLSLRFFPELRFFLDEGVDHYMRVQELLREDGVRADGD